MSRNTTTGVNEAGGTSFVPSTVISGAQTTTSANQYNFMQHSHPPEKVSSAHNATPENHNIHIQHSQNNFVNSNAVIGINGEPVTGAFKHPGNPNVRTMEASDLSTSAVQHNPQEHSTISMMATAPANATHIYQNTGSNMVTNNLVGVSRQNVEGGAIDTANGLVSLQTQKAPKKRRSTTSSGGPIIVHLPPTSKKDKSAAIPTHTSIKKSPPQQKHHHSLRSKKSSMDSQSNTTGGGGGGGGYGIGTENSFSDGSGSGGMSLSSHHQYDQSSSHHRQQHQLFSQNVNTPETPLGRVVESGQEQTGRWTREEHDAFLQALRKYGKEWKKVAAKVKTRTVVQTRTHAQKYFQKLQKAMAANDNSNNNNNNNVNNNTVDNMMLLSSKDDFTGSNLISDNVKKKRSTSKSSNRQHQQPKISIASGAKKPVWLHEQAEATTAAAQLMAQMSSANTTMLTSTNMSQTKKNEGHQQLQHQNSNSFYGEPSHAHHAHTNITTPSENNHTNFNHTSNSSSSYLQTNFPPNMKIVVPNQNEIHNNQTGKYRYPDPSPAACGKRKLAEIAAAQMLAGVAAAGSNMGNSLPTDASMISVDSSSMEQHHNNLYHHHQQQQQQQQHMNSGLMLQIVNPDILVPVEKKNKSSSGVSPGTPWDGQLEALGSKIKAKENFAIDNHKLDSTQTKSSSDSTYIISSSSCLPPLQTISSGINERSLLHSAIIASDKEKLSELLISQVPSSSGQGPLNLPDVLGYTPLHSAACLGKDAAEITKLLLTAGADNMTKDKDGNTALHWASRAGNAEVAHVLTLRNCLLDAPNDMGETPLHWAMRAGTSATGVVRTILADGARPHVYSKQFRRPLDVAALGFSSLHLNSLPLPNRRMRSSPTPKSVDSVMSHSATLDSMSLLDEIKKTRENFFLHSPQSRTLILHNKECSDHVPKSETDWEVPDRVDSIVKLFDDDKENPTLRLFFDRELTISDKFERASVELLSRVHSPEYLTFVHELSKKMELKQLEKEGGDGEGTRDKSKHNERQERGQIIAPFTPLLVQRSLENNNIQDMKIGEHSDTAFSAGSLRAARRAAGAVQYAVDCVLMGRNSNAFCIVRPPGHHAGYNGLPLVESESSGFCIFNNIAAGAMHALSEHHSSRCKRCAIIDIDVHHGNGTEDIVQKINDPEKLLFFSVHLFDQDQDEGKQNATQSNNTSEWKFYPGTGLMDDLAHNVINVPIAPLWKDGDNETKNGSQVKTDLEPEQLKNNNEEETIVEKKDSVPEFNIAASLNKIIESSLTSIQSPSSHNEEKLKKEVHLSSSQSHSNPPFLFGAGREAYKRAISQRLIPALRAFNPDLILLSTGFDAAKFDVGNEKYMEEGSSKMGINLEPEDYSWTTKKIMEVANICCQGRIVSVLEGGYGRQRHSHDKNSQEDNSQQDSDPLLLDKSIFSECAAMHIAALIDPYDLEMRQHYRIENQKSTIMKGE